MIAAAPKSVKTLGNELAGKVVIVNALTPETFESPILVQLPPSRVE
jgi:2-dehydro-3-deoxy-L-rhamnonate dehydrogenase (NAD+)